MGTDLAVQRNGMAELAETTYREYTANPTPEVADKLIDLVPSLYAEIDEAQRWAVTGRRHREAIEGRLQEAREQLKRAVIDAAHLARQRDFSERTFGPDPRTEGVLDHLAKEMEEIRRAPRDLGEWVDVIILGFDGAWRAGHEPQDIIDAIIAKQARNENREWPDWRTAEPGKAIEHDRTGEVAE